MSIIPTAIILASLAPAPTGGLDEYLSTYKRRRADQSPVMAPGRGDRWWTPRAELSDSD